MGFVLYEGTNLESGEHVKGSVIALSRLTGIGKQVIYRSIREKTEYRGYRFRKVEEKKKEKPKSKSQGKPYKHPVYKEWDKIYQIYSELIAGERVIRKGADGKWYAMKV